MTILDLNTTTRAELSQQLTQHHTVVACLCAAWCDVCTNYRTKFEAFAAHHPELLFLWIDIEDQAELVGDVEVDNFPTLLIQHHDIVTFFGTMQPDTHQLKRLLHSLANQTAVQSANPQWQSKANLLQRLAHV